MNRRALWGLLFWAALAVVPRAHAQPVTTIYSFINGPATPLAGLTFGNDGNLYGTTDSGGLNNEGTAFKMTTNGNTTTLVNFGVTYAGPTYPEANLTLGPDGNFYGTSSQGGTNVSGVNATGTVFKMTTNGTVTTLASFNGVNGGIPLAGLALAADGNFYGTTEFGGTNGDGTVFKVTTNGTLTSLVSFNGTNGMNPYAGLVAGPGGNLYGTTRYGGTNGSFGTVFAVTTNGAFSTLVNFAGINGAAPLGVLTLGPDGNLYGTTSDGVYSNGASDGGTVFEMTTNGVLTTLVTMTGFFGSIEGTSNGVSPHAGLTLGPDGNFYGTTYAGGTNGSGAVFEVTTNGTLAQLTRAGISYILLTNSFGVAFYVTNEDGNLHEVFNGTLTTLYSFTAPTNFINTDGAQPQAGVSFGPDGNIYGTAASGGANGYGTAFKLTTNGIFTTLTSFTGNHGDYPMDALTPGPGGSLYGTANSGGTLGYGTVFQLNTNGALTTLVNFDRANYGANPQAGLIVGPGGNFYGTAVGGGTNLLQTGPNSYQAESYGTVFELTTNGSFTTLAYFNNTDGANPYGGVAVGTDGNLYGTTTYGGIDNDGTIFKLLTNGTLTALTNFTGLNGANPFAGLTLGLDGNFYGTCEAGGSSNLGTVFQVLTNGTLTTLANFTGTNGSNPNDGLTLGTDGNFYGTAWSGGSDNAGTVFKVTTGGTLTTLVNFAETNGQFPVGGLALGPDGDFYGTTELGGVLPSSGTVFKLATNGVLTTLVDFVFSSTSPNGNYPFASLTLATNGNFVHFYGTTYNGPNGPSGGGGTIFRLNLTTAYTVTENSTNTFFPLTNDVIWTTGGTLSLVNTAATNGTGQINGSGIVFKPAANFIGTAGINYAVTNSAGGTNFSFISVLVTNILPAANPDFYSVAENSSANVLSPLVNDQVNTSGGVLGLVSVSATNGTASISGTNVLFTPTASFTGTATIGYTITDNVGGTNTSLITVTVANISADLSLSVSESPNPINATNLLTYTFIVSNAGPATATDVTVSNELFTAGSALTFNSATGGSTPTNGILLINLGSLAPGATNVAQMTAYVRTGNQTFFYLTNTFQVYADQTDPQPANNFATMIVEATNAASTFFTTSSAQYNSNTTTTVTQQTTNYTTELIAKLPNGTVVYDQTFTAAYSNMTVQAAIVTAAADLTNDGASSYTGPAQTSSSQTTNNSSVTVPVSTNITVVVGVKSWVGPVTFSDGNFGIVTGYTFDPVVTNYAIPTGGTPSSVILTAGQTDVDTMVLSLFNFFLTTTNTATYTNSSVYVMTGVVASASADLKLSASAAPEPVGVNSNLVYSISITNQGPNTAAGVVMSNQIPAGLTFVSATGGATPVSGVLLLNLGSLTNGVATNVQITVQPTASGKLTNVFQVFSSVTDPVLTNNSASVVSTVTNALTLSADLSLSATAAPEPVGVNSNLVYSISITNQGPNAAAGVVLSNQIPAGVTFVSATGGATPSSGILLLNLGSLTNGVATNVQITVQPTASGKLTNVFQVFSSVTDPVLTNNSASVISTVTNGPPPPVDVAVSVTAAPNPVAVGAPLTYSVTVTNNSVTTATGVVISNTLPPGVTLFSLLPSQGSANTNQSGVVIYSVGSLANGVAATLAIVVIPNATNALTNSDYVISTQTDSQPANNRATNITTVISVPITNLVVTVQSPMTLNPQTGLYEQQIEVSNGGPSTPSSVLVEVSGLAANATLYNAAGKTNGLPYVQSASPLGIGSNVVFLLEFFVPTRVTPTNLTYIVQAVPTFIPPVASGTIVSVRKTVVLAGGNVLVEFNAIPGQIYAVQYSSDMTIWRTATPVITATANEVQWIDSGPPQTISSPGLAGSRYYRVVLLTKH